jgi:glycosyltransferase involved in cell wall biosynthesis
VSTVVAVDLSTESAGPSISHAEVHVSTSPLVSVIIPCYNGEAYIEETITSALWQTYQNIEILVIDDGSTDGSAAIVEKFPVRYIRQENRGLTPTRNRGVRESRGSYIVFLDADDRLMPEAIETGLRMLTQNPDCSMAVGDHCFISGNGSHLAPSQKPFLTRYHFEALLRSNFIEMISSVMFRKDVLEKVGGFDTSLRVAEDYDLYLRIARDHAICCHRAVVAEYRWHQSNASHNSELMLTMTLQVLQSHARHARRNFRHTLAYLTGLRSWRKQYGRQLASELFRSYSRLRPEVLRRKLLTLLNYYPQGFLILFLYNLNPKLDKRNVQVSVVEAADSRSLSQRFYSWLGGPRQQTVKPGI